MPWDQIAQRNRNGEKLTELAQSPGIGLRTVHRHLRRLTPMRPSRSTAITLTDAELAAAHAAGTPVSELARQFDASTTTIRRRIHRLNRIDS